MLFERLLTKTAQLVSVHIRVSQIAFSVSPFLAYERFHTEAKATIRIDHDGNSLFLQFDYGLFSNSPLFQLVVHIENEIHHLLHSMVSRTVIEETNENSNELKRKRNSMTTSQRNIGNPTGEL